MISKSCRHRRLGNLSGSAQKIRSIPCASPLRAYTAAYFGCAFGLTIQRIPLCPAVGQFEEIEMQTSYQLFPTRLGRHRA